MFVKKTRIEDAIREAVEKVMTETLEQASGRLGRIGTVAALEKKTLVLREDIEKLKIEKDRREEEFDRKERDIEHKIGLERKRQEFEIKQAKQQTELDVREANLKADRDRFDEQLGFHEERFTKEVGYLKDLLTNIMKRLPTAEIYADVGHNK